jgi:hypothetical protein
MFRNIGRLLVLIVSIIGILTVTAPSAKADDLSHGRDCATAREISPNSLNHGVLTDSTDIAVYRVVLDQRGLLDVWTDPGSFTVWDMELLDAWCVPVPHVTGGVSVVTGKYSKITVPAFGTETDDIVWTIPKGVYFIRMLPAPVLVNGQPFAFHVKFVPHTGHDCTTAEAIPASGSVESAMLYSDDREMYRIHLSQPARVHAFTTGPAATRNEPVIGLYFSDCSSGFEQEFADEWGNGLLSSLLEPGTYYLSVEPFRGDLLTAFTLHVEYVNDRNR